MSKIWLFGLLLLLAIPSLSLWSSGDAVAAGTCNDGNQASGAVYRICMPGSWNQDLVIYAHGFVDPAKPVAIPEDQLSLPDGTNIPDLVNNLGYAFATTSYRKNGLAILEGVQDIRDLVQIFTAQHGPPDQVFLVGASEGGLVTALAVERYPETFAGGIAACGPIGDFPSQVNYFGDMRVVFDYFFPGLIPGSPIDVPADVTQNWDAVYEPLVRSAMAANPAATQQIIQVTKVPTNPANPASAIDVIAGLLWYNVVATNDAIQVLGGQPFDNSTRVYSGSSNDTLLNQGIQRFTASAEAVESMNDYQTEGPVQSPIVVLHTTGDPIVPYLHAFFYDFKSKEQIEPPRGVVMPIQRFGHCAFQVPEVLYAFFILNFMVWYYES